jgi:putative monooxygenase
VIGSKEAGRLLLEPYRSRPRAGTAKLAVVPSSNRSPARKVALRDVTPNRRRGGDIRVLLGPATVGATSGFFGVVTLEPGEYVSEHYHPYSEEFLYTIRGGATVRLDGTEVVDLDEGEGLLVPIGVRHRVSNRGATAAVLAFHLGPLAERPELGHVNTEPLPEEAAPVARVAGEGVPR